MFARFEVESRKIFYFIRMLRLTTSDRSLMAVSTIGPRPQKAAYHQYVVHVPGPEAEVGQYLTYVCKEGLYIDKKSRLNIFSIKCLKDGSYEPPKTFPVCK